jgi:hypothetical protein
MKQYLRVFVLGILLYTGICGITEGGVEEFAIYNIEIQVTDAFGSPIQNAFVRIYSKDWFISYPQNDFARTDAQGICSLSVPRGRWAVVVGGGEIFNARLSGQALFLYSEVYIESNDLITVYPDRSTSLLFLDRLDEVADVDAIYGAPSEMVPNCKMPNIGNTKEGNCTLFTNMSEGLSLLFIRKPTNQRDGYYIFEDNLVTTDEIITTTNTPSLKHVSIAFDSNGVDNISNVTWHLCFPYQDRERANTFSSFSLKNLHGDVYTNIDYLNYTLFLQIADAMCQGNVMYWFRYQGVDLSQTSLHAIRAGGAITRQFRFADRSFFSWINDSQFLLGPIVDAYGNEIRYYTSTDTDAPYFAHRMVVTDKPKGTVVHDADIELSSGGLAFTVDMTFPETATFRLEWDMGPYWKEDTQIEGLLYDDEYRYTYEHTNTEHYDLHTPIHGENKVEAFASQLENAYAAMIELLGNEPSMLLGGRNFYVNPLGNWAHGEGQELYYGGYSEWHPSDPASLKWTRKAYHEIGHRVAAEMYHPQYSLSGPFGEATANTLADYVLEKLFGEAFAIPHRIIVAHIFFSSLADGIYDSSKNSHFIMEVYLPQKYGIEIHKQFYRNWIDAYTILKPLGYEQMQIYVALYSLLADENLAWLFKLCGQDFRPILIKNAVAEIASLKPAILVTQN